MMKKLLLVMILLAGLVLIAPVSAKGFNEFGYNDQARIFVGSADGVDRELDGAVWGDPTYANDHLVMKWNSEWTRGKVESWNNPPYAAWENNEWNGRVPGGSGEMWHYKIVWVGACGVEGNKLDNGGYCIWGQFAVIMDQGSSPDRVHEFLGKANPAGYGSYK